MSPQEIIKQLRAARAQFIESDPRHAAITKAIQHMERAYYGR